MMCSRAVFFGLCLLNISAIIAQTTPTSYVVGTKEQGTISYYTNLPRITASGEKYDNTALVGCHKTLPFGSKVKITNLGNNKSITIRINDRGPYAYGRIMDISEGAALQIDLVRTGTAKVEMEVLSLGSPKPDPADSAPVWTDTKPKDIQPEQPFAPGSTYTQTGRVADPIGFTLQLGSFDDLKKAKSFCQLLRERGLGEEKIYVDVVEENKKIAYKILLGEWENRQPADAMRERVKLLTGRDSFVRLHTK